MSLHETPARSDEWYTPRFVFEAMGTIFDLDVAAAPLQVPANEFCKVGFIGEGALESSWFGLVWMNPPFGRRMGLVPWLERFFAHDNGVALVPDRTSCPWWQDYAPRSDAILMVRRKIHFIPGPGALASSPAQGTTLLACGEGGVKALSNAATAGLGSLWRPDRGA